MTVQCFEDVLKQNRKSSLKNQTPITLELSEKNTVRHFSVVEFHNAPAF